MHEARRHGNARVRRARALVGVALGAATWAAVGLPASGAAEFSEAAAGAERQGAGGEIVVVADRDTLWDLARAHAPEGVDRRQWAAEVAERNGIDPREIRAGDTLRLPAD